MAPLIAPHVPSSLTDPVVPPAASAASAASAAAVTALHRQLPYYAATPLRSLPVFAAEVGVGQLFLKDESNRFGLPSFKILGASWAVHCALARAVGLPQSVSLAKLAEAVCAWNADAESIAKGEKKELRILATTEGNWGRAVARMAQYAGHVPCKLYVPTFMPPETQEILRSEGAQVHVLQGKNYDDCVAYVRAEAEREGAILVLDVGFDDYEDVPQWVVEGCETMLVEADEQVRQATGGRAATHVVVPVGAGSIAQAVVQHYKGKLPNLYRKVTKVVTRSTRPMGRPMDAGGAPMTTVPPASHAEALWDGKDGIEPEQQTVVLAVEADTAACLRASLASGRRMTVATADTIMCGLNCGTLSMTAWPILQRGVDYCVAVSDRQAHAAVQHLYLGSSNPRNSINKMKMNRRGKEGHCMMADDAGCPGGVAAGPCGAATLAGLRKVCSDVRDVLKLDGDSVVVLLGTEGPRPYDVPPV